MTVVAQFSVDGDPADFDRVIAAFDEDALVAIDGTDLSPERRTLEGRVGEADVLS